MRKYKVLLLILIVATIAGAVWLKAHFELIVIASIISFIFILYLWKPDDEEEEPLTEAPEFQHAEAELKQVIINSIEEKEYKTGRPTFVVQPMLVVSEEEFNEKTNQNLMENKKPKEEKSLPEAPKKLKGVTSYSITGVHIRYRKMFDDFHSFAITHGPQTEEALIGKLAPYGFPYTIERAGALVAFNLNFIRMPRQGFFDVK